MTASLNPYISLFGEEFDAEKSQQYKMTIQFSLGGLSYALLDTKSIKLIALECYQSDLLAESNDIMRTLERALEAKELNGRNFQQVICIVDERINTLIPAPLFDPANKEKYLDFSFHLNNDLAVFSEKLEAEDCYNIFAWSKALIDKVQSKWKTAIITQSSSLFIGSAMRNKTATGVFVNVRNRNFDMVIKKEGKLFFFNNFKFNTKEDFTYFLMFAMEQNNLSGHDTPVWFSGLILPASEIVELCKRYVKDIRFVEDTHELHVSAVFTELPFQYYHIHYETLRRETQV